MHKLEFPAIQSPSPAHSMSGDEVFITADDLEGYSFEDSVDQKNLLCNASKTRSVIKSCLEEEVLVTETDLKGYETFVDACDEFSLSPRHQSQAKPMIRKLSCLFASLKFSVGNLPVAIPPIRAG